MTQINTDVADSLIASIRAQAQTVLQPIGHEATVNELWRDVWIYHEFHEQSLLVDQHIHTLQKYF